MMSPHETGMLLHKVYTSMSQNFGMQLINSYHHHLSPHNIDHLVNVEMKRLKAKYLADEERFVEQMLTENPVVVERRPPASTIPSKEIAMAEAEEQRNIQHQRSESCRKSRVNNKIKKAKAKFRHKFAASTLAQSSHILKCLQSVIGEAEAQLIRAGGRNQVNIQRLRNIYGLQQRGDSIIDTSVIEVD